MLACVVIAALPYVINAPGNYCLQTSLSTAAQVAVTVNASDVVLDLQGNALIGTAGPSVPNFGISGSSTRVVIRNGIIRGFTYGVMLTGGMGFLVEDLRVTSWYFSVSAVGSGAVVRRCAIAQTGGATISGYTIPIGLRIGGSGSRAEDNSITSTTVISEAVGIHAFDSSPGMVIRRNTISNSAPNDNSWAVWVNATDILIEDNVVVRYGNGFAFPSSTSGVYRGNTLMSVTVTAPSNGGAFDGGDNVIVPALATPVTRQLDATNAALRAAWGLR